MSTDIPTKFSACILFFTLMCLHKDAGASFVYSYVQNSILRDLTS